MSTSATHPFAQALGTPWSLLPSVPSLLYSGNLVL